MPTQNVIAASISFIPLREGHGDRLPRALPGPARARRCSLGTRLGTAESPWLSVLSVQYPQILLPSALRDEPGGHLASTQPPRAAVWGWDVLSIVLPHFQINVFILEPLSELILQRLY